MVGKGTPTRRISVVIQPMTIYGVAMPLSKCGVYSISF